MQGAVANRRVLGEEGEEEESGTVVAVVVEAAVAKYCNGVRCNKAILIHKPGAAIALQCLASHIQIKHVGEHQQRWLPSPNGVVITVVVVVVVIVVVVR